MIHRTIIFESSEEHANFINNFKVFDEIEFIGTGCVDWGFNKIDERNIYLFVYFKTTKDFFDDLIAGLDLKALSLASHLREELGIVGKVYKKYEQS